MTNESRKSTKPSSPMRVDSRFRYKVMENLEGETLRVCYQCGTCTACCPVARLSASFRPRTFLQMVQLGMRSEILSSETLWMCTTCFTCNDRCPQGVEVASIIRVLLNMAVKKGILPSNYKELASNMLKTGYTYRFTKARLKRRTQAKLPTLPKPNLKDIAKLAKITDFSETIES